VSSRWSTRFDVTLVMIKRSEIGEGTVGLGKWERAVIVGVPEADRTLDRGDTLVVFGRKQSIEQMIRES